jgi:phage terminase Nu1 subunit (DNA packaging protein)
MTADVVDLAAHRAAQGAPEGWCRKPDVARHFGVSVRTVERWPAAGMPSRKASRSLVLFRPSECETWVAAQVMTCDSAMRTLIDA